MNFSLLDRILNSTCLRLREALFSLIIASVFLSPSNFLFAKNEPSSEIKSLISRLGDPDPQSRKDAENALKSIGPPAAKALGEALLGDDEIIASTSAIILGEIGVASLPFLKASLEDERLYYSYERVLNAANAFKRIGPPAVRTMIEVCISKDGYRPPLHTLMKIIQNMGSSAVPELIGVSGHTNPVYRHLAVVLLGRIRDRSAIPFLINLLGDEYRNVRIAAAIALKSYGSNANAAVPNLIRSLEEYGERQVKEKKILRWEMYRSFKTEVVAALSQIAPYDQRVINTMVRSLNDEDYQVRGEACKALGKIGNRYKSSVSLLIERLEDRSGHVRAIAASALGRIGKDANAALQALVGMTSDTSSSVRMEALGALGKIAPGEKVVLIHITKALGDEDPMLRSKAAQTLGQMRTNPKRVVPILIKALAD